MTATFLADDDGVAVSFVCIFLRFVHFGGFYFVLYNTVYIRGTLRDVQFSCGRCRKKSVEILLALIYRTWGFACSESLKMSKDFIVRFLPTATPVAAEVGKNSGDFTEYLDKVVAQTKKTIAETVPTPKESHIPEGESKTLSYVCCVSFSYSVDKKANDASSIFMVTDARAFHHIRSLFSFVMT